MIKVIHRLLLLFVFTISISTNVFAVRDKLLLSEILAACKNNSQLTWRISSIIFWSRCASTPQNEKELVEEITQMIAAARKGEENPIIIGNAYDMFYLAIQWVDLKTNDVNTQILSFAPPSNNNWDSEVISLSDPRFTFDNILSLITGNVVEYGDDNHDGETRFARIFRNSGHFGEIENIMPNQDHEEVGIGYNIRSIERGVRDLRCTIDNSIEELTWGFENYVQQNPNLTTNLELPQHTGAEQQRSSFWSRLGTSVSRCNIL